MKMKRVKVGIYGMLLLAILSLSACGARTADRTDAALLTARDTAECMMESLKPALPKNYTKVMV